MAEERLGASFSIDVTALKAGLTQANRLIRESESEFKAAAAGMDDWSNSQEGLEARIKHLTTAQGLQQEKVKALKKQYEEAGYASDDMSAAAVKLRTDINKEQEALNKTEKELRQQEEALNNLEDASDDASDSVDDLSDSAKNSGDGFTIAKGAIADLISNGIQNLVGACKNAISSIWGLAESTQETRVAFAKLEQSFDTAGFSAETAGNTMSELYGVLGDTDKATEASNLIAKMSKTEKDLEANTRILTGVYAEYGDSIPTEGLAEGMAATAAMGNVQGVLADALEWQGINLDEYNEKLGQMTTEEERAAYIQQTLTDIYGESADKYRENNQAVIEANEAQLEYDKTLKEFGDKILPITTTVKEGFNKILQKVLELVDGVDIEAFGDKVAEAFDTFINDVMPKIIEALTWIKDNKDVIIAGITGIGAAFAAFKVVTLIQSVVSALKGMTLAQAALNAVMALNPIGLVIAAVVGLVAAFVVLWNKCEGFRDFWKKLWEVIKKVAVATWEAIKKVFSTAVKFFTDVFTKAWDAVKKAWSGTVKFFKDIWNGITTVFSNVVAWFKTTFTNAWTAIKNAFNSAVSWFQGIWTSIKNVFSSAATWFGNIFSSAWTAIKNAFSSATTFFNGIWTNIKNVFSSVKTFFGTAFSNAWQAVKDAFSGVGTFFGGIWDTIKEKFSSIGQKVGESISGAFKTAINAVLSSAETVLNTPINAINGLIDKVSKYVSIPKLSTFSLPRLAKGGVVEQATTAIIGEDGAEAVVPLERNKEWIKEVAREMAAAQPQGVVVNQTNNYSQAHSRLEIYKSKQATAAAVRLAMGRA